MTALLVNAAKGCDSAIQDDNWSDTPLDNCVALASKQTFVVKDNRFKKFNNSIVSMLQTDEDHITPSLLNATTAATSRPPTINENDGDDDEFEVSDMNRGDAPVEKRVTVQKTKAAYLSHACWTSLSQDLDYVVDRLN